MKRFISGFLVLAFMNLYTPAMAASIKVPNSIRIQLSLSEQMTSKTVEAGEKIEARIAEDIFVKNVLVFAKGDRAYLNVSDVKKAGFCGIAGNIYVVNGAVFDVQGHERGVEYNRKFVGDERTWPKVLTAVGIILWPLLLFGFVKGGQAKVNTGQLFEVSVRNDFVFNY